MFTQTQMCPAYTYMHLENTLMITSEENQKTQPGFKPRFSSNWWGGFLFLNNQ